MNNIKPTTQAHNNLLKFRNQVHEFLKQHPDVRIVGDREGDVMMYDINEVLNPVYLPRRGTQQLITGNPL